MGQFCTKFNNPLTSPCQFWCRNQCFREAKRPLQGNILHPVSYAVVGSGPCGTLAALLLLQAGQKVVMFEVDSNESIESKGLSSTLKLVNGSSAVYDIHQLLAVIHKGEGANFYRSKLAGGFSNVWGATWGPQEALKSDEWNLHHQIVTNLLIQDGFLQEMTNQVCNCLDDIENVIPVLPSGIHVKKTLLALNPDICECIRSGYTSCIHGSVWNSSSLLNLCFLFDDFKFNSAKDVVGIENNGDTTIVKGEGFAEKFQDVILAAGTVGTLEVLLNSNIGSNKLVLQDTLMGFLPLLRFGVRKKHKGGFAFSRYSLDTKFGGNNLAVHIQLYADAEIYRDRIIGKFPIFLRSFSTPILKLILPHIAIAIIYGDTAISPKISFTKLNQNRQLHVDFLKPTKSSRGLRRRLWRVFRSLGFLPLLPLLSWSQPGESYHLGAMEGQILNEFGSVRSVLGLHVAGAISLPSLEPGPITHSSMAQTSRLIEHLLTKI